MTFVAVGDVLAGKYRVDKVLGIGGMGMVVAAMHLELEQKVALKFMLPDAMLSPQATDRFLREARNAVKLRSEHVCRVLDVGKLETGAPYIVMEFMEGQDFAHVIAARGRMSVGDGVDHVMQAMEGLAEAHAQGIVHRDLKPGNLFVTVDNEGSPMVKVLDFGISKSVGGGTKTGEVMGSPAYMAPEQMASSKNVDARADIWALGVILYQAITGAMPFEGDTLPALCMSVLNATPPTPNAVRADLPAGLAEVVMRCLEKSPDKRYASVGELAEALAPFGSAEAARSATGIAKVLRRTGAAAVPTPVPGALVAPTVPPTIAPTLPPTVALVGRNSTLQSSAAQLEVRVEPPKKRSLGVILGGAAVAIVAVIAIVVTRSGGHDVERAPTALPEPPKSEPTRSESPKIEASKVEAPKVEPPNSETVVTAPEPARPPEVASTKPIITKPVVKKTIAAKPVDAKPVEAKVEAKPVETKPVDPKPAEPKPAEPKGPKWKLQYDGKEQK